MQSNKDLAINNPKSYASESTPTTHTNLPYSNSGVSKSAQSDQSEDGRLVDTESRPQILKAVEFQKQIDQAPRVKAVAAHTEIIQCSATESSNRYSKITPAITHPEKRLGREMPDFVRQNMESLFGTSFADVRVHEGPLAASMGAAAFAHGSNIHFAPGQFAPYSASGRRLLAHELAHVVQQRAGRVRHPGGSEVAIVQDQSLELEAAMMGQRAAVFPSQAKPGVVADNNAAAAEPVIQCARYKSDVAKKDYVVTRLTGGKKHKLQLTEHGGTDVLAEMYFEIDGDMAYMTHVEAYDMPGGTGAGYLLFYEFAVAAQQSGVSHVSIGTGVDERSANRNMQEATTGGNEEKIAEARRQLAAVHIYQQLGFDASDAKRLSNSKVAVADVLEASKAKVRRNWQIWTGKGNDCFLTTACTEARGLPDDCYELTVLRRFRDTYILHMDEGSELIKNYYRIAPSIVTTIQAHADPQPVFDEIYDVVRECVCAVEASDYERALTQYSAMVEDLTAEYGIAI